MSSGGSRNGGSKKPGKRLFKLPPVITQKISDRPSSSFGGMSNSTRLLRMHQSKPPTLWHWKGVPFGDLQELYPGTRSAPSLLMRRDALKQLKDPFALNSDSTYSLGGSTTGDFDSTASFGSMPDGPETAVPLFDDNPIGGECTYEHGVCMLWYLWVVVVA